MKKNHNPTFLVPLFLGVVYLPQDPNWKYNPSGKRDPFKPWIHFTSSQEMIVGDFLTDFNLDQIKLVGVMWDVDVPKAIVKTPGGKLHTLTKGEKIGRNRGKVAAIRESEMVVIEEFENGLQTQYQSQVMTIKK